jgi:hypothetical protein
VSVVEDVNVGAGDEAERQEALLQAPAGVDLDDADRRAAVEFQ